MKFSATLILLLVIQLLSFGQYEFTPIHDIPCTEIKSQDKTGTCWSFAASSMIESEHIKLDGQPVNISEMFVVRHVYYDKARNYLFRQGKANFSQGSLAHDMINVFQRYGAVPEEVYSGLLGDQEAHNHSELEQSLKTYLDNWLAAKDKAADWSEQVNSMLDKYLGACPETFEYAGKAYDAMTFAEALNLNEQEYISITSFTHQPFYSDFILEIPDNYSNGKYFNVPLDNLVESIDHALREGYTITWDGDVSALTFSAGHGIAILPKEAPAKDWYESTHEEEEVSQDSRQKAFENFKTTDDHLMHIVGKAKDQNGNEFYKIKNSWGEVGPYGGYLYMSKPYLKMKTIAITANKLAIPPNILEKMQL